MLSPSLNKEKGRFRLANVSPNELLHLERREQVLGACAAVLCVNQLGHLNSKLMGVLQQDLVDREVIHLPVCVCDLEGSMHF